MPPRPPGTFLPRRAADLQVHSTSLALIPGPVAATPVPAAGPAPLPRAPARPPGHTATKVVVPARSSFRKAPFAASHLLLRPRDRSSLYPVVNFSLVSTFPGRYFRAEVDSESD